MYWAGGGGEGGVLGLRSTQNYIVRAFDRWEKFVRRQHYTLSTYIKLATFASICVIVNGND